MDGIEDYCCNLFHNVKTASAVDTLKVNLAIKIVIEMQQNPIPNV